MARSFAMSLTPNAVYDIVNGGTPFQPVVQVCACDVAQNASHAVALHCSECSNGRCLRFRAQVLEIRSLNVASTPGVQQAAERYKYAQSCSTAMRCCAACTSLVTAKGRIVCNVACG